MDINKISNDWTNDDLQGFYENIPVEELALYAQRAGLDDYCDLDLVKNHIDNAQSILEVGAGYGRVIEGILKQGYKDPITAIERSEKMCDYLKEKFQNKVEIIHGDIRTYQFDKKFDVILLMWSSIVEYSKIEQMKILKHLKSILSDTGMLIADTIAHVSVTSKNATTFKNQTYIVKSQHGTAYGYVPSPEEMEIYAHEIGFLKITQISYKTKVDCSRIMHILQ